MYELSRAMAIGCPQRDSYIRIQEIFKKKTTYEKQFKEGTSFTGVLAQKERLQNDLDKALDEIEKLRTEINET